jgi:MHS family alpha-ketoglutarate permease-like MFS transporter
MRAILAGSIPNLVQWFNLYVFATFAPYFRGEFFGTEDAASLAAVYAVFALTFLARPIGSWLFGRYADRRGRQRALLLAVLLMSACSLVLAVTPGRDHIGAWAVVILIGVSVVQGIATGGEYAAAAVYLTEAATAGRKGFFSSFQAATIVAGQVLGQGLLLIVLQIGQREAASTWGWRFAFALAGLSAVAAVWAARRQPEAPSRRNATAGTMRLLLRQNALSLVWVIALTAGGTAAFYTYTVTVPTVVRETFFAADGRGERTAALIVLIGLVVLMLLQPLAGALSDRIGRKPLLIFSALASILFSGWFLQLVRTSSDVLAVGAAFLVAMVVITGYLAVNGVAKAEAFPPEVRALGVGLGYAVANSLFGGTAPAAYHAAVAAGDPGAFTLFLSILLAVTLVAAVLSQSRSDAGASRRARGTADAKLEG